MRTLTHIEALTEFATTVYEAAPGPRAASERPVPTLAKVLGLRMETYQFTRVLTWIIAFYYEAVSTLNHANIAERNRDTAKSNLASVFAPFLPPFQNPTVAAWYTSAMSATNQSYFDLLNDVLIKQQPIHLPEASDIDKYKTDLASILSELKDVGLPPWIEKDFQESIQLTLLALDKIPFVAHKIIQDAHNTILARLFSIARPEHRKFMVRVATTINVVLAAFVMPYEATEAAHAYYGWMMQSPVDVQQIEACATPLALPPPTSKKSSG